MNDFLQQQVNVWNKTMYANKFKLGTLSDAELSAVYKMQDLVRMVLDTQELTAFRHEIMRCLPRAMLLGISSVLGAEDDITDDGTMPDRRYRSFVDLLSAEGDRHHDVGYYATQLCVSAKYLSAICMRCSGKSAKELIDTHLMESVRFCVRQSELSMKEISAALCFPSATYFGRFVKRQFGCTPSELRQQLV